MTGPKRIKGQYAIARVEGVPLNKKNGYRTPIVRIPVFMTVVPEIPDAVTFEGRLCLKSNDMPLTYTATQYNPVKVFRVPPAWVLVK